MFGESSASPFITWTQQPSEILMYIPVTLTLESSEKLGQCERCGHALCHFEKSEPWQMTVALARMHLPDQPPGKHFTRQLFSNKELCGGILNLYTFLLTEFLFSQVVDFHGYIRALRTPFPLSHVEYVSFNGVTLIVSYSKLFSSTALSLYSLPSQTVCCFA